MRLHLISGNPMEPASTDIMAQFDRLAVGQPVPDGWRVLSGNSSESEIARVAYRFEVQDDLDRREREAEEARESDWAIALYEMGLNYGGPEEGGWYYSTGNFQRTVRVVRCTRAQAGGYCARANGWLDRVQAGVRKPSSSIYGGGYYRARVEPAGDIPAYFPSERPHYE